MSLHNIIVQCDKCKIWVISKTNAHWRHGLRKYFSLTLKRIPKDIRKTLWFVFWAKKPSITIQSWVKFTKVVPKIANKWPIYEAEPFYRRYWRSLLTDPLKYISKQTWKYALLHKFCIISYCMWPSLGLTIDFIP